MHGRACVKAAVKRHTAAADADTRCVACAACAAVEPHWRRSSKLAPLLARTMAGVVVEAEALGSRLQQSHFLLARELKAYLDDPSAGAVRRLNPIKVRAGDAREE